MELILYSLLSKTAAVGGPAERISHPKDGASAQQPEAERAPHSAVERPEAAGKPRSTNSVPMLPICAHGVRGVQGLGATAASLPEEFSASIVGWIGPHLLQLPSFHWRACWFEPRWRGWKDSHFLVQDRLRASNDGKRLNPRKADLQAWRERFAGELRLRGIAAEATPRRTRGRVRKADRGAVLAIRKRKITPDVDRLARKEVLSEIRGGKSIKHPWNEQIESRQDAIRRGYLDYAAELQRSGAAADHELARQVRQFVGDLPAIETRRHALKKELSELAMTRRRDAKQDVNSEGRDKRQGDERTR